MYRGIFSRALTTAWNHRELWPVAVVAGFLGSGSIFLDLIRQGNLVHAIALVDWQTILPWGDVFAATVSDLSLLDGPVWTMLMLSLFLLIGFIYACLIGAQHALLRVSHRALHGKERVTFGVLLTEMLHPRFGSMALFNLGGKILTLLVLLCGGLELRTLSTTAPFDIFFGIIFALVVVWLAFAINTVTMLSLVEIAEEHTTVRSALAFGLKAFHRSPLIAVEFAALQFGWHMIATFIFLSGLTLLGFIGQSFTDLALSSGSPTALFGVGVAGILLSALWGIIVSGAVTTVTYASWAEFAHTERKDPGVAHFARMARRHLTRKR